MSEEIWFFAHLIVSLTDVVIACAFVTKWRKNVLTFDNKNKKVFFILYCVHLIVPLTVVLDTHARKISNKFGFLLA